MTVPVVTKGKFTQTIPQTCIDNGKDWARKHLAAIKNHYCKAPYFDRYFPMLEEGLNTSWEMLLDLDLHFIRLLDETLGLGTNYILASSLSPEGKKAELIVNICELVGADEYLNGAMGRGYLSDDLFRERGIRLMFQDYDHPVYRQCYDGFVSHLSVIDLLFNCGDGSRDVILSGGS